MPKPLKILQASAGSGKTFSLTAHYLSLLFGGANKYREILAVTFTNKATEEMKSRILMVLRGLAKGDVSRKIDDYRKLIIADHPSLTETDLQLRADQIYRKILHDYSRFAVSTIDGFVQKVIRGFAFELGLDADYNLEMNYDKVKDDLVQKLDESLNENPQLLQWIIDLALERISDNKSWNYKSELNQLINEIFKDSFQIFDEALRALDISEIDEFFRNYSNLTKAEINRFEDTISSIAANALKVIEQFGIVAENLKGKSKNPLLKLLFVARKDFSKVEAIFCLIDQPEEWLQKSSQIAGFYEALNPVLRELKSVYEEKQPDYELAIAFHRNLYYLRLMQEIASLLSEYRNENDNLLISDAQKLIKGITDDAGGNPSFIWEKMGNRYRHFLFDEFQDTSTSQWSSFRSLLSNVIAAPSENFIDNLIVGDAKQSIYRWRNGDWNILHRQAKIDVGEANVEEAILEENYRSTANIISFNNYLYQSIPIILQQELNADIDQQKAIIRDWWQEKGYDKIITEVYESANQNIAPSTQSGGTIKVKRFGKDDASNLERMYESDFREIAIADVIEEIKDLKKKGYPARELAILVRSNHEALFCVNKLMEQDIPVISGDALLIANNASIKLIINSLRVFVGIDSQTALYKANCIALYHQLHLRALDPASYLNLKGKPPEALIAVLPPKLCLNWQSWMALPLAELIENLIDAYELKQLPQHLPYLLAFRDLIANSTRHGEKGIMSFLSWWEEDGIKKSLPSPESADAVQIITIHKSKGLAFRAIFVPFCNWEIKTKANSIFWVKPEETLYKELGGIPLKFAEPLSKSSVSKAYFNEVLDSNLDNLNMLYVATTRAKDFLYMSIMDKTDRSKMTNIGDVLAHSVSQLTQFEGGGDFDSTNRYEILEDVWIEEEVEHQNNLNMEEYPTTDRLSELYVLPQEKHLKHILNIEKSGRKGSVLHDVLANASSASEVDDYLMKLMLDGDIQMEEMQELRYGVLEVLEHPELKVLFAEAREHIIEKTIIDVDGKPKRPDRIIVREHDVAILDYKFTLEESTQHINQVLSYRDLLAQMGYTNIKAYLFYAAKKELKRVEL